MNRQNTDNRYKTVTPTENQANNRKKTDTNCYKTVTPMVLTPSRSKVSLDDLLKYRVKKGLTQEETAQILGVSRETIARAEARYRISALREFIQNRAERLAHLQMRILESLSDADIQKCHPRDRVWMLAVLFDKERLERGKSTVNVAFADMVKAAEQARRKLYGEKK